MKKTIIVITSVFALAATGFAQNTSFGVKAGITHNSVTYKVEAEEEKVQIEGSNAGFYVGGIANIRLSENFTLQPNLLFIMKGGGMNIGADATISTMHIDVPVNFLYTNNGFFIGAGPNFSYALNGKIKLEGEESVDIFDEDESDFFYMKKFELGANVLMGYTFPNGITVSANYTPGISNIAAYDGGEDVDIKSHNKMFGISIGYMFGGKGK